MRGERSPLLALLLLPLASGCPSSYSAPRSKEAKLHRAKTSDGWEISLVQYPAAGQRRGRPVLLCHGISANGRHLDLDREHSLAQWLASRGREAWIVSLRGAGESDRIDAAKGRHGGYDFDTLWREDLAAAIRAVRERAGGGEIDYVGHSMGGMLVYAYLSQGGEGLGAAVTLGSPTRLDWGGKFEPLVDRLVQLAVAREGVVPMLLASQLSLPFQGEIGDGPLERLLYNPRNIRRETWKRLIAVGTADISGAVMLQLVSMVKNGRFQSADGKIDYREDMAKVQTPVLVVAGKADRIAITPAVKDGYRALGGPKEWLLVSEANGALDDYGHLDLIVGDRAATEVWPRVLDFLDRNAGVRD